MKNSHTLLLLGITVFIVTIANAVINPILRNQQLAIIGVAIAGLLIAIAIQLSKRQF